jgi:DICT domain-containing protein
MSVKNSVIAALLKSLPDWRSQMYFKSSLTALSHAMEDQVLAASDQPLIIASFQKERFYRQEAHRYGRIGQKTPHVYVLSAPETDFCNNSGIYETIAFTDHDALAHEWHLVVLGENYATCLLCREKTTLGTEQAGSTVDNNRRFEGIWTFDRQVTQKAATIMLERILIYRPELKKKINQAKRQYLGKSQTKATQEQNLVASPLNNPDPFVQRLITYLQAGQYKLIKANRSLISKEHKERLINSVTTAIRRSLDPEEILQLAVEKLGDGLGVCRCIIYRCQESDLKATIDHEFLNYGVKSLKGQSWPLKNNPLFQEVLGAKEAIGVDNTDKDPRIHDLSSDQPLEKIVQSCSIVSWLLVPVLYQDRLLGMVELHHCHDNPIAWKTENINLVNAIATQVGVALIQAEAYANLENLNEQLEALDRTRSNLVAITGHELRTPFPPFKYV